MIRRITGVLLTLGVLMGTPVFAFELPPVPAGFVNDFANIFSDAEEQELESRLTSVERDTSAEIAVLTVPSLDGDTIEELAVKTFEQWGIGKQGADNGVLLLFL